MRFYLLSIIFLLSLSSCYENQLIDEGDVIEADPEIEVEETGVTGRVTTEGGELVSNYTLSINGENYTYDNNVFYQRLNRAKKRGQFIFLYQNNRLAGVSNAYLIENDVNYVDLVAFPEGTELALDKQINIHPNFTIETNDELIGNVGGSNMLVNHKSTTNAKILNNLGTSAKNSSNELLVIKPQLAIHFDVYVSNVPFMAITKEQGFTFLGTLEEGQGLFYLDRDKDEWLLKSPTDKLLPGFYTIAQYGRGVYVEGDLLKENEPVSFMPYSWAAGLYAHEAKSSSQGKWGAVTQNESLIQYELQSPCGDLVQSFQLDGTQVLKKDYEVSITENVDKLLKVDTQVFDCEGNIQNYPAITVQDELNAEGFIYPFQDSEISTWVSVCSQNFELGGYDIYANESGALINWSLDQRDALNYLSDCNDFQKGYSYIKIKDDMRVYEPFEKNIVEGGFTQLLETNGKIQLAFKGIEQGAYGAQEIRISIDDPEFANSHGYFVSCAQSGCGINEFDVTHYETSEDGWLRVSFSGEIWMLKTSDQDVAAVFEVEGVLLTKP